MSLVFNMVGGGGGSGGILTVNAPPAVTVTVTNDDKTYTRIASADGVAVFKGLASGTWYVSIADADHDPTEPVAVKINADYEITLAFFAAYINITYPAGSTCKATCGTLEIFAPDTSGTWALTVPNAGTWTIYATDGTREKTTTVSIFAAGESASVLLKYELILFDNGDACTNVTGGWVTGYGGGSTATVGSSYIQLLNVASEDRGARVATKNAVDTSAYNWLKMEYTCSGATQYDFMGLWSTSAIPYNGSAYAARKSITNTSSKIVLELDISGVTSDYHVGMLGGYGVTKIYKVWLE